LERRPCANNPIRKPGPKPGPRKLKPLQAEETKRSALALANARIAELKRLVGRQQLDIDFFRKALRALERPAAQGKTASASSKSLKP
jgi:transposase